MLDALKRLLSPEYLLVAEPGPLAGLWVLYVGLGLLFAAGLASALWLLLEPRRTDLSAALWTWAWFELWICLAGLATVIGRFLGWPGWSARIWPYSLAILAMVGAAAYQLRNLPVAPWLSAQLRVLAFSPTPRSGARSLTPWLLCTLLIHLGGITSVVAVRFGLPLWTGPLVLLALLLPQVPLLARRQLPQLMALSPLFAAYAALALSLLYKSLGIPVTGWQGLTFPNPMLSAFYLDGVMLAAVAHTLLCQLSVTSSELGKPELLWRWALAGLLAATLAWAGIVYFGKRTHGATASDPYAYAQMSVDLAERGTFLHRFSLFEQVMPLQIAWAPLQPVGYHIPRNEQGDCPSVWATGASVLLAAGYALLGETGLYITTPLVALLSLAATWALVQAALRYEARSVRFLAGALAVTLLATSPEHVDRLLVPMADAPAQLFTVLTLFLALTGMHRLQNGRTAVWLFLLAGLSFGGAYWVRHTQLVLALPVLLAILLGSRAAPSLKARAATSHGATYGATPAPAGPQLRLGLALPSLVAFCSAALLAAAPDIVYRWRVFGGPFATETTELPLMAIQHIGPVAWQMAREALAAGEWGYLFPLALLGVLWLAPKHRSEAAVLGVAFLAVLLVHLTYRSLRLRDLISIFPLADLAVASGAVALVGWGQGLLQPTGKPRGLGRALLPAVVVAWVVLSLALSRWAMLDRMWRPGWASFGYMKPQQRAAFDRLAALTPPEAVIGASLNAGAIAMYTGRDAIRPYDSWTDSEWRAFLASMEASHRPVYLLDDGEQMAGFIELQQKDHQLTPLETLEIPLFYARDRDTGWLYRLEWVP
jgi:hypothetical protein